MERKRTMKGVAVWLKGKLPELLVLLLCMLILGLGVSQKEGYHMDELLSFQLSNAEFNPWIVPTQPEGRLAKFVHNEIEGESLGETLGNLAATVEDVLTNRGGSKLLSYQADVYEEPVWITGEQFQDYVTVDKGDAFHYLSVYFNVKDDNHPPLHFMLLHTVSSVFQGKLAPVMGCVINMLCVAVCMVLLMKLGRLLAPEFGMEEKGRLLGLFAAAMYGLSAGAMATVLLIRMYGLVTLFCVALLYIHVKKWLTGAYTGKNKLLILVTVMGFLTQYFFLFYCLILAAVTAVLLWRSRRRRELWSYVRSMVIAAIIGVGVFPFAISDVFSSGRGTEALGNLTAGLSGYGERLAAFGDILLGRTIELWVVILLLSLLALTYYVSGKKGKKMVVGDREAAEVNATAEVNAAVGGKEVTGTVNVSKSRRALLWLLITPVVGYFLLAARMAPYLVDRYIMPLFPLVILSGALAVVVSGSVLERHYREKRIVYTACGIMLGLQLLGLCQYDGAYLYTGYREQLQVAEKYSAYPCICVYDGVGYYENLPEFVQYEKTLLVTEEELAGRKDVASVEDLDKVVVLLKSTEDWQQIFEILNNKYGLTFVEELASNPEDGDKLYLFKGGEAG